jgi:nitrite reductase/ring-hydroxylating ferredoxin subunit
MSSLVTLCATTDVPSGGALRVAKDNLLLAVFNLESGFYVTDDTCTHGPGSLADGMVDGEIVECNFHSGCFHIPTGRVEFPPCMIPIATYAVTVVEGNVCIDPSPRPLAAV